jgi:hypothetical protein
VIAPSLCSLLGRIPIDLIKNNRATISASLPGFSGLVPAIHPSSNETLSEEDGPVGSSQVRILCRRGTRVRTGWFNMTGTPCSAPQARGSSIHSPG